MLHIDEKIFNLKLFDRWRRKKVKQMMEEKKMYESHLYIIYYTNTHINSSATHFVRWIQWIEFWLVFDI